MSEKVVYLLGAGFSAPLGIPVMDNFFERSKDIFDENQEKYSNFEEVFSMREEFSIVRDYYKTDLLNIEEVLSILEMHDNLSDSGKKSKFKSYIIDVVKHCTPNILATPQTSGDWLGSIFGGKNPIRDYGIFISCLLNIKFIIYNGKTKYDSVIKKDIQSTYSVVTLNYDLIFENLCELINKHTDTNSINKNFLGFYDHDRDNSLLEYAKLHGSIDSGNIILPTWNKGVQNDEITSIWKLAYNVLSEANYIRIIGYSLPVHDSYVEYLLKSAAINSKKLKKIDVICLDENNEVRERYKEFIGSRHLRFKSSDVRDYLRMVLDDNDNLKNQPDTDGKTPNIKIATLENLENVHERFMSQ